MRRSETALSALVGLLVLWSLPAAAMNAACHHDQNALAEEVAKQYVVQGHFGFRYLSAADVLSMQRDCTLAAAGRKGKPEDQVQGRATGFISVALAPSGANHFAKGAHSGMDASNGAVVIDLTKVHVAYTHGALLDALHEENDKENARKGKELLIEGGVPAKAIVWWGIGLPQLFEGQQDAESRGNARAERDPVAQKSEKEQKKAAAQEAKDKAEYDKLMGYKRLDKVKQARLDELKKQYGWQ
jgi:hypothetical protein